MTLEEVSLVDPALVEKNIKNHPYLSKHFGWILRKAKLQDAEEFPLAIVLSRKSSISEKFVEELDETIGRVSKIKYLNSVIRRSKNKQEFWDAYSEISVAKYCVDRGIYVEFLPQNLSIGDLKAKIDGKEVFFEVKHLVNSKVIEKLENNIRKTVSPYIVGFFTSPFISDIEAEAFLTEIRIALKSKTTTERKLPYGRFTTYFKKQVSNFQGTPFMAGEIGFIPIEPVRIKLASLMRESHEKFHRENVNLIVLDIQRWTIPFDYVKMALYGENKDGVYYEKGNERITGTLMLRSIAKDEPRLLENPIALRSDLMSQLTRKLA